MEIEIDRVSPAQWDDIVDRFEDASLYQTWAFGAASWGESALSHLVIRDGGEVAAAAQVRLVKPRLGLGGFAYIRWGPMGVRRGAAPDPAIFAAAARALREEYSRRRGLYVRVLPNAFEGTPRAEAFAAGFREYDREAFRPDQTYRAIVLDLSPSLDQVRKAFDPKWRNHLNQGEKKGLTVADEQGPGAFPAFIALYRQMLDRKQFGSSTDMESFARMQEILPERQRMKVFVCRQESTPVAAVVGTALGDSGIYLHGATSEAALKLKAAYLLQWRMMQWLKEGGVRYYNLGGVNPVTNPGVFSFKSGTSGADLRYLPPFAVCDSAPSRLLARLERASPRGWVKRLGNTFSRGRG